MENTNTLSTLEQTAVSAIEQMKDTLCHVGQTIYALNEVSTKEFKSSAFLSDKLKAEGFDVTLGLTGIDPYDNTPCPMPTAFKATYEKIPGGPTLCVMLEYDALAMGHACGHNLISSSCYGAAMGIKAALDQVPGKLVVYGTPAEETGGPGKTAMVHGGFFDDVDVALITHPGDRWYTASQVMAIAWPRNEAIVFKGIASHAAANPDAGRSALKAAMLFCTAIDMMREHVTDDTRMHYIISNGGEAPNIVPEEAAVNIFVRCMDSAYLYELLHRIDKIAQGVAMATETTVSYTWDAPWFAGVPVPTLYDLVRDAAFDVGVPPALFMPYPGMYGSSDFGCVAYAVPTMNLDFPIGPLGMPGHSTAFLEAANSTEGHQEALTAAKAVAVAGCRLLQQPELIKAIKNEFHANKRPIPTYKQ